jgi:hypothetical protein
MSKKPETTNPPFDNSDDMVRAVMCGEETKPALSSFWHDREHLTYADMFCGIGVFHAVVKDGNRSQR